MGAEIVGEELNSFSGGGNYHNKKDIILGGISFQSTGLSAIWYGITVGKWL